MSQTKLISLDNLTRYDGKIKELIGNGDTTYSLSAGTGADANKIVLTPSTGNPDKVTVPYATNAGTVNSHTVATDVPASAVFTDTTYSDATTSASGLMSASDKSKMDGLGTASTKDVATSGNASSTQVVMGNDTRLSDSRPASDVSSWAKASSKPSYTASEVGAIATTAKGANNGVAELDSTGKVPSAQLPSYVDDVLEYGSISDFPITGETGKIYIAKDTNKTYRWSGTTYVEISESLALGETASTAYAGNKGKANADAIAAIKDGTSIDSFADVESALSGKVDTVSGKGLSTNDYTTSEKNKLAGLEAYDGFAGQSICYFESSNPNVEIYITGAGTTIESALGSEDTSKNLYMIRFTADAPATLTGRLFEYDEEYPVATMNPDLPIIYFDGTPFTREIHAGDYIIIKLTGTNPLTGMIVADFDSTSTGLRSDVNDVIGWDNRKNLLNYDEWKKVNIIGGSGVFENNGITLTATGDCYTGYNNTDFPVNARIPISEGETITLSWQANNDVSGIQYIFPNGSVSGAVAANNATKKKLSYTAGPGVTYVTFRFGVGDAGNSIKYSNIQIEKGATATQFEPYHPVLGPTVEDHESRLEDVESGLANVENIVDVTNQVISIVSPNNTYISELRVGNNGDATLLIDEKSGDNTLSSLRLNLSVYNKRLTLAYYNGSSWQSETIHQFS